MKKAILLCAVLLLGASGHATCPTADVSGDCYVGPADLAILASQWESEPNMADFSIMAGQWLTKGIRGIVFVDIPGGTFQMGDSFNEADSDELPVHAVALSSFRMSKYEITNQQYCDYLNSAYPAQIKVDGGIVYMADDDDNSFPLCSTSSAPAGRPNYGEYSQINYSEGFSVNTKDGTTDMSKHPMVMVSWYGSVAYCNWKSQQAGLESCYDLSTWQYDSTKNGIRLPTEAEWEYAARGGEHSPYYRYPWGNFIDGSMANYISAGDPYETGSFPYTTPAGYYDGGQIPAGADMVNGYGLYDMAGNVWEWCSDWYSSSYYSSSPDTDPAGPATGSHRVFRGGSWNLDADYCRVANRGSGGSPDIRDKSRGFRVCLD